MMKVGSHKYQCLFTSMDICLFHENRYSEEQNANPFSVGSYKECHIYEYLIITHGTLTNLSAK